MNIPLASEPYWDYYDALAAVIDRILTLADGGQLKNFGTDIQSPELVERAKSTIAQFENFGQAFGNVAITLRQNLNSASEGLARKSA
jgi:hypothetical protein